MGLGSEFMWDYSVLVVEEEGRDDDDEMERASVRYNVQWTVYISDFVSRSTPPALLLETISRSPQVYENKNPSLNFPPAHSRSSAPVTSIVFVNFLHLPDSLPPAPLVSSNHQDQSQVGPSYPPAEGPWYWEEAAPEVCLQDEDQGCDDHGDKFCVHQQG